MPRSAIDATRFTATGPHAYSKSNASTIQIPQSSPPAHETPAQKVIRLRAAAQRAKLDSISTWDKMVLSGKLWADRAHRVTAMSLVGFSVVASVFATYSIGSMMLFNRRKRSAWFDQQQANYEKAVAESRKAERNGTLTEFQRMFLRKENALRQMEAEQSQRPGAWKRVKGWMFGGLAAEERPGGALGFVKDEG